MTAAKPELFKALILALERNDEAAAIDAAAKAARERIKAKPKRRIIRCKTR